MHSPAPRCSWDECINPATGGLMQFAWEALQVRSGGDVSPLVILFDGDNIAGQVGCHTTKP